MEFKEKSAKLKVACPACGLARSDGDVAGRDEPVCCCDVVDAELARAGNMALAGEGNPEETEPNEDIFLDAAGDSEGDDESKDRDFTGETLVKDDFQVLSRLGQGCVTDTYLVRNKSLKRKFVLKLLVASYNKNPRTSKRFRIATTKAVQLSHPNIVSVYEADQAKDGSSYAVSEYIESATLADVIKREGFLDTHEVVETMMQACEALQYAHENKIIHRGIKPSNIFLVDRKPDKFSVKVSDFGTTVALPHAGRETHVQATHVREFGDPRYMSPEQCVGERLSPASDIYSLGCVMYEALCGKTPFASKNPMTIAVKQMTEEARPISSRFKDLDIPEDLEAIVMRALIKDPRKRYQTPAEMMKDLQRFTKHKPVTKPTEAYFATRNMLSSTIGWLSQKSESGNIQAVAAALMVVAIVLGLVAVWFLYGVNLSDPTTGPIPVSQNAAPLPAPGPAWANQIASEAAKIASRIGSSLTPSIVTLKDTRGRVLYSNTAPNVRTAVEEAIREHVDLAGVDLRGENLGLLTLKEQNFTGADFSQAFMSGCSLAGATLNHANLAGAVLNGAILSDASAPGACFAGCQLRGANMKGANLEGSDFTLSRVSGTNFSEASLSKTNFSLADIQTSDFLGADLTEANVTGARFVGCEFNDAIKGGRRGGETISLIQSSPPAVVVTDPVSKPVINRPFYRSPF
jgi:serine/threonine protein kinase/uncharacterized protein YjbI with pentapeptide repeats